MTFRDSLSNRASLLPARLVAAFSLLVLTTLTSIGGSQDPQSEDIIRIRTDLIAVPFAITDSRGRRVPDLSQANFVLTDDGRVVQIEYFASGPQRVALTFLLDNSGSLREQLARQKDASLRLFSRFGTGSSVAVIRFGQHAKIVAPFTNETVKARAAFDAPVQMSERTAIFDAALAAVHAYEVRSETSTERRIVILVSDGLDTASQTTARQVIEAGNRANVSFYVIQLPLFAPREGRLVPRSAAKGFRDLAEKTGGTFFVAGSAQSALNSNVPVDLDPIFAAIEADLRSQYVVGFYPGAMSRDGRTHRVAVTLSRKEFKNLKVHQLRSSYELKQ